MGRYVSDMTTVSEAEVEERKPKRAGTSF